MRVILDPDDPTKSVVLWPSADAHEATAPPGGPDGEDG